MAHERESYGLLAGGEELKTGGRLARVTDRTRCPGLSRGGNRQEGRRSRGQLSQLWRYMSPSGIYGLSSS